MNLKFFSGRVTSISDYMITSDDNDNCYQMMSLENNQGMMVNFVISPMTYFVQQEMVTIGDNVTGYYDGDIPVPMIYPPQYRAIIVAKDKPAQNVKVDYFNDDLVSSDGQLKLNIASVTQVLLRNGQAFLGDPQNRTLIVTYDISTKSIPAQTTPSQIIVWCSM